MEGTESFGCFEASCSWGGGDQTVAGSLYIPTMFDHLLLIHNEHKILLCYTCLRCISITWQDIETLGFGVDMTLFKGFNATFDWIRRDTKNMIVAAAGMSYNLGSDAPNGNYGSLRTKGWEISLNYGHLFNNGLSLSATASISDAVTTITEYGTVKSINARYNGKHMEKSGVTGVDRFFKTMTSHDANGN